MRFVSKVITKYQLNARLQSKLISGSESSMLAKVTYHAFNLANHKNAEILQKIDGIYRSDGLPLNIVNKSLFFNKNVTMDELIERGETFVINKNGKPVHLTKAEVLTVYML